MLKKIASLAGAAVFVSVLAPAAVQADAPAKVRQDLMKTVGFSTKTAAAMVKGEQPYDPVQAELTMRAINAAATAFPFLFPDDSKTGHDTEASPKIWEDRKGFLKQSEELQEHSAKGIAAAKNGLDAFKKEFADTVKYCKSCHETYRIKKQ